PSVDAEHERASGSVEDGEDHLSPAGCGGVERGRLPVRGHDDGDDQRAPGTPAPVRERGHDGRAGTLSADGEATPLESSPPEAGHHARTRVAEGPPAGRGSERRRGRGASEAGSQHAARTGELPPRRDQPVLRPGYGPGTRRGLTTHSTNRRSLQSGDG